MNENHVVCLIIDAHDGKFPYVMNDLHIWSIYGQPIQNECYKTDLQWKGTLRRVTRDNQ